MEKGVINMTYADFVKVDTRPSSKTIAIAVIDMAIQGLVVLAFITISMGFIYLIG